MKTIAVVTGASRGIGAATARLAAQAGYDVCVNYVANRSAADSVVADCEKFGVRAIAVQADVADRDQVQKLFLACDADLGPVSLLVNNAGIIGQATPLASLSDELLRSTFATNVFGSIYCAQEAIRRMARSTGGQGGVIVNVSSAAAVLGSPGEYVHYAASKGAVETLTIGLAKELGADGIRVNAVRAGTTNTDIHATTGNPDRPAMVARTAPLGRVAEPEDIAEAIIWLASEKASFATGAIVGITGGL